MPTKSDQLTGKTTLRHRMALLLTAAGVLALALGHGVVPAGAVNAPLDVVVSGEPVSNTPYVLDGTVYAIAPVGDRIVVGGGFSQVKDAGAGPVQTINNLFVYDKNTGRIDQSWMPAVNGQVNAVVASADGRSVFVGGQFNTVNGETRSGVVKLDVTTGALDAGFNPGLNGWVLTVAVHGDRVYAGGFFTKARNLTRTRLVGLDAATGQPDALALPVTAPIKGTANVKQMDVSSDGSRLVIVGNFKTVAGAARSQIAVIDLTASALADWDTTRFGPTDCSTSFDTYLRDIDISPDGTWFSVVTTGAWRGTSTMCDTASRWELDVTGSGQQPSWTNFTGGDTLTAVAITDAAVYVGGHQRWMNNSNPPRGDRKGPGAVDRDGLAALDPTNGVPLTWNPGRARGVGVFAMEATPDGLYIGHDTNSVAGQWHPRLAFFPAAGGTPNPKLATSPLPGRLWSVDTDGTLTGQDFDGTQPGSPYTFAAPEALAQSQAIILLGGKVYSAQDDGTLLVYTPGDQGLGDPTNLNSWTSFAGTTGLFFDNGRLYFTKPGDPKLYYRYFTPESGIVGSQLFVASGTGDGFDWSHTQSLTMASDNLYSTDDTGRLHRTGWAGGKAAPGTDTILSGPAVDGRTWSARALLITP